MAQILMVPAHAEILDKCRSRCLQAVTYFEDDQAFRASQLMAEAYRQRNQFPVGSPAYALCQEAITTSEERIIAS